MSRGILDSTMTYRIDPSQKANGADMFAPSAGDPMARLQNYMLKQNEFIDNRGSMNVFPPGINGEYRQKASYVHNPAKNTL